PTFTCGFARTNTAFDIARLLSKKVSVGFGTL
ncbi:hypothetical protein SAMN02746019_00006490, partial [Thermoflexus hugenholtzii JAD2]